MTDATLGTNGVSLGTRTGAGGTATLTKSSFGRSPWLHEQQVGIEYVRLELLSYLIPCTLLTEGSVIS